MFPKKVKLKKFKDSRGSLVELLPRSINKKFIYSIISKSKKNVIRGMHYDLELKEEKLVYILEGKILDVCINLSKGKYFKKKFYNVLQSGDAILIPKGYAHGYRCYGEKNLLIYFLTKRYNKKNSSGIIWNDKSLKIKWKITKPIISNRDLKLPPLNK